MSNKKKSSKVDKSEVRNNETVNYELTQQTTNHFRNVMSLETLFDNICQDKVITVNMTSLEKIDFMNSSRIAMFRKAVFLNMSYEQLVRYDVQFYSQTNDRSKSRKADKQENLYDYCYKNRTSKQLRDVLKESSIVNYLNKKHNMSKTFFTVSEYRQLFKKV